MTQATDQQITDEDLEDALDDLSMLEYWRTEIRASVKLLLAKICPHRRALHWLVEALVNRVNRWPGPAEVRGLLCTRFDPRDGIDAYCTLPGYSAEEQEAKYLAREFEDVKALPPPPRKALEAISGAVLRMGTEQAPISYSSKSITSPRTGRGKPPVARPKAPFTAWELEQLAREKAEIKHGD